MTYGAPSSTYVEPIGVSALYVASMYVLFNRNWRALFLFSFLPLIFLGIILPSWSKDIALAYLGVLFVAFSSYNLSGMSLAAFISKVERFSRVFIQPLYLVERGVSRFVKDPPARSALAIGYFALQIGLIVVLPYFLGSLSGGVLSYQYTLLTLLVFFGIATGLCMEATRNSDASPSRPAGRLGPRP